MKKFLTVLLALSVVFTYTVGTAFAAVPSDAKDKLSSESMITTVEKAYTDAKADLLKAKTDALYDIFKNATSKTLNGVTVSKSAVEAVYNAKYYDKALAQAKTEYENMLQAVQEGIRLGADYFYIGTESGMQDDNGKKAYPINTTFSLSTATQNGTVVSAKATYAALFSVDDIDNPTDFAGNEKNPVAQEQAKQLKEAALKAIRAIDLTVYSKDYNGEAKSNYDLATDLVAAAIAKINTIAVTDGTTWEQVFVTDTTIVAQINDVYTAPVNQQKAGGKLYTGGLLAAPYAAIGLNSLDTISDAPSATAKMEWAKSKVLEALTSEINTWLNTNVDAQNKIVLDETLAGSKGDAAKIAAAKTAIEEYKSAAAAATEVATYLVNNTKKLSDLIAEAPKFSESTILVGNGAPNLWYFSPAGILYANPFGMAKYDAAKLVAISEHVADLKQDAENKKASVMIDGAEYVAIEKALEKAIDECYTTGTTTNKLNVGDTTQALWDRIDDLIDGANGVTVNNRKYNSVSKWLPAVLENTYDKDYFDAARKAVKDAKDAIEAAKTIEDADAAFLAGLEKFEAVPTKAAKAAAQSTKEFADLLKQYKADIDSYVEYKASSIINTGLADKYSWKKDTLKTALQAELDKAYTVDELKAKLTEAKAVVDGLKTQAELDEAKKALDARVAAVATADKETVGTLKKDLEEHNDYCDMIGNIAQKVIIKASVQNAYDKFKAADADAIKDAIRTIGTVTVDDKAAIKAVREQLDAYVSYYAGENATDAEIAALEGINYNGKTVADLEKALDKAEINAFYVMVGKLPADGSDVAGIKAAKDAYEALSLDAKKVVYRSSEYDKLLDLEKLLVKNVEALKITASSAAGKGYIKVKWTTKGVAAAADGYQVYRSTKRNSGFGTKPYFTTKNKTYKNTKSLKKGKRYYYKVRAYVEIDGQKYYSDWSNKAYRIAK